MAYSTVQSLLLGNIPLPTGDIAQRAVDRAADEIDSVIGFRYKVPILVTGQYQRPVMALLFNVNNHLASGRLIAELTASTQNTELHAYAARLIADAHSVLAQIASGSIVLPGADPLTPDVSVDTGPLINNLDSESNVEAFYDRVTNPIDDVNERALYPGGDYLGTWWWR